MTDFPNNSFIGKLEEIIWENLSNEQFGVEELARAAGMSRSNLHRKVKKIEKTSVSQYIRKIRLNHARELLQEGELTVSEVTFRTGFSSVSYFSRCFKEHFGFPPGSAKHKTMVEAHGNDTDDSVAGDLTHESKSNVGKKSYILAFLVSVPILVLIGFLAYRLFSNISLNKEKSIAVLPFTNESPDEGQAYIINGLRDEILDKLSQIKDLSVASKASADAYRGGVGDLAELGRKLGVKYLLTGSGQTLGSKTRVRIQLIEARSNRNLWSSPFEREITMENIFSIQEEVALSIADELKAVLSDVEKKVLESMPTKNKDAYNHYLQALDWINIDIYNPAPEDKQNYYPEKAIRNLKMAVKLDSNFISAYLQLAHLYTNKLYINNRWHMDTNPDSATLFLDSAMAYLDTVFSMDPLPRDLAWAKRLRGHTLVFMGRKDEAVEALNVIPEFEDSYKNFEARFSQSNTMKDYENVILNFLGYLEHKPTDIRIPPYMYLNLSMAFKQTGHKDLSANYLKEWFKLKKDTLAYYRNLGMLYYTAGDFKRAEDILLEQRDLDSLEFFIRAKIYINNKLRNPELAMRYYLKLNNQVPPTEDPTVEPSKMLGTLFYLLGNKKEADYHMSGILPKFEKKVKECEDVNEDPWAYLTLASIYAYQQKKKKAMVTLQPLKNLNVVDPWYITELDFNPLYDPIRDEQAYLEIVDFLKSKHQNLHNRIQKLLDKNSHLKI